MLRILVDKISYPVDKQRVESAAFVAASFPTALGSCLRRLTPRCGVSWPALLPGRPELLTCGSEFVSPAGISVVDNHN
jgi:hypothetical protein